MTETRLGGIIALIHLSLSQQFWEKWIAFYLSWLHGRKKWLKVSETLKPGQMMDLSSLEDISKRGRYKLGEDRGSNSLN